jgi:putative NIF3 family GTP cyclohydrolase 1 type 2
MSFYDLKDMLVKKLNLESDKISFYKFKDNVKKIVIIPGSGSSDVDLVIANKPDVVITSELKHNQIIDLKESNISYLNATHYGLENIFINCFLEYLKSLSILSNIKTMSFDINL